MASRSLRRYLAGVVLGVFIHHSAIAQTPLPSPQSQFGFAIGDDYQLATYTQFAAYWGKLATASDRMQLDTIGLTAEGRPQLMAIISSPQNLATLERYRSIAARLARAEALTDAQARTLAHEGKAVVWIDGGLHATEVLGAAQLIEHSWQMVSQNDPETLRFLDDVIQLLVHANPDGMELVSGWYMRRVDSLQRSTSGIPRLYQKYIGHDNNRDFYLNAMPETANMSRVMFREWYPQIIYNHHQTGPRGTVMFMPPFRDPFNYVYDPLIPAGLNLVGAAMETRMAAEQKPGTTRRYGANYSTWWNGGLRTTAYFHNMIGLLTETIGNPTPTAIPLVVSRQHPNGDTPYPIAPQPWHFRQSIAYSLTANRAVLDVASKHREDFLYNIYLMGRNAIAKGSQDSWTRWPHAVARIETAAAAAQSTSDQQDPGGFPGRVRDVDPRFLAAFEDPATRDPRGYILPSDQADFPTATKFVNSLIKSGIDVSRATTAFEVAGKAYPAGSYVIQTAQAFRPHIIDMMEPQDHPDDIPFPGAPPRPPYDNAGYTLAMQMGVAYDRILEGFTGPFEKIPDVITAPAGGHVAVSANGWLLRRNVNDASIAVNRLLAAGQPVHAMSASFERDGERYPAGTLHIPLTPSSSTIVTAAAHDLGLHFDAAGTPSTESMTPVRFARIGLADRYGGSMPSGWIRFLLEQFEFPFEVVYPERLDTGNLHKDFDLLIFPDGLISARGGRFGGGGGRDPKPEDVPPEYRDHLGAITAARTVPALQEFMHAGGTVVTIGGSTSLAQMLGLPFSNHLAELSTTGEPTPLPRSRYFIPASLLQVRVDTTHPIAWGYSDHAIVMYDESPVFHSEPAWQTTGIRPIAWFDSEAPLRSGWAWGQGFLKGGVAAAEAQIGAGRLLLFGPEITFRGQPHGTFRFLFNSILTAGGSGAKE